MIPFGRLFIGAALCIVAGIVMARAGDLVHGEEAESLERVLWLAAAMLAAAGLGIHVGVLIHGWAT